MQRSRSEKSKRKIVLHVHDDIVLQYSLPMHHNNSIYYAFNRIILCTLFRDRERAV